MLGLGCVFALMMSTERTEDAPGRTFRKILFLRGIERKIIDFVCPSVHCVQFTGGNG